MSGAVRSMTGAATHVAQGPAGRLSLEARSVNHRFLKTSLRVDGRLPRLDALVEELARERLERGHVTIVVRYDRTTSGPATLPVDEAAFGAAAALLKRLAAVHSISPPTTTDVIALAGHTLHAVESDEDEAILAIVRPAIATLLEGLQTSRAHEGAALARDLLARLDAIGAETAALADRAALVPALLRQRLAERVAALAAGLEASLDEGALEREIAVLAERGDVGEEIVRLGAHVDHARTLLAAGGSVGKRLDFLAQEMQREANTIGSKAQDLLLTHGVVALKSAVERLREQVQNLE